MTVGWSEVQMRRLKELGADAAAVDAAFAAAEERDRAFQQLERRLVKEGRRRLREFYEVRRRPALCRLESTLIDTLVKAGFAQVATPTIIPGRLLKKMSIDQNHPLYEQIFWLEKDRCLRPMLAPGLYYILKDLLRLWEKPVRIFEVGSCFRKETRGARHSAEFTMLNLVEMGLKEEDRDTRLAELAALVTGAAGIEDYVLSTTTSAVYGQTVDVEGGPQRIELGSGAVGPHHLDRAWAIDSTWVGIGFGLERLLMVKEGAGSLAPMGRSLTYLDGTRLSI